MGIWRCFTEWLLSSGLKCWQAVLSFCVFMVSKLCYSQPIISIHTVSHSHVPLNFTHTGFELSHCDDPGVPQFGFKVSDQGHFAGSAITYGCDQGYTLHGSGILKCMTGERRAWDNHLPSCIGNPFSLHLSAVTFFGSSSSIFQPLSVSLSTSLSPSVGAYIIIQARHTVNIAQLDINPKDLSLHDFYLIELCWKKIRCLLFCRRV